MVRNTTSKAKAAVAALALFIGTGAFAGTTSLGTLHDDDVRFGRDFWRTSRFVGSTLGNSTDYYSFTLDAGGSALGGVLSFDNEGLDLTVTSLSLSGGTLAGTLTDTTPNRFDFSGLGIGTYVLGVSGRLNAGQGTSGQAHYAGTIHAVAAPVPEPEHALMLFGGLAGLGLARLRRKGSGDSSAKA